MSLNVPGVHSSLQNDFLFGMERALRRVSFCDWTKQARPHSFKSLDHKLIAFTQETVAALVRLKEGIDRRLWSLLRR
jgi:hypothetical protein